jgi:3-oxoacyl-[acyl-carrier protein] reductase
MKLLEGKVAIITGASRGIGKRCRSFANMNKCCFTYSSSVESALANELNALGIKAKVISQTQLILMRRKPWLML